MAGATGLELLTTGKNLAAITPKLYISMLSRKL